MEETQAATTVQAQQQGLQGSNQCNLDKRWLKQVKYENFMECAQKMWDQFTSGAHILQQRRRRAQAEEREKQQADRERQEKIKKDMARKQLAAKLKRQAEERRKYQEIKIRKKVSREEDEVKERRPSILFKSTNIAEKEEKLNLNELRQQHNELKDKIDESRQKFLEEGLARQRKMISPSLGFDHYVTDPLDLEANQNEAFQKNETEFDSATIMQTTDKSSRIVQKSRALRKRSNLQQTTQDNALCDEKAKANRVAPNMDYFKHILEKKKTQKMQQQHLKPLKTHKNRFQSCDSQDSKSFDNNSRNSKEQKNATARLRKITSKVNLDADEKIFIQNSEQNIYHIKNQQYSSQEAKSTKASVFPLDQVLPAFNLNRAMAEKTNFIPKLKIRSSEPPFYPEKAAINSQLNQNTGMKKQMPVDPVGYGHMRVLPSQQALLKPILNKKVEKIAKRSFISMGSQSINFTEEGQPPLVNPVELQNQLDFRTQSKNLIKMQQAFAENNDSDFTLDQNKSQDPEIPYLRKFTLGADNLQLPAMAESPSFVNRIGPLKLKVPPKKTVSQDPTREPHVIMIDLDLNRAKDALNNRPPLLKELQPPSFKKLQADLSGKTNCLETFLNAKNLYQKTQSKIKTAQNQFQDGPIQPAMSNILSEKIPQSSKIQPKKTEMINSAFIARQRIGYQRINILNDVLDGAIAVKVTYRSKEPSLRSHYQGISQRVVLSRRSSLVTCHRWSIN